jgi:hypothetical protein
MIASNKEMSTQPEDTEVVSDYINEIQKIDITKNSLITLKSKFENILSEALN